MAFPLGTPVVGTTANPAYSGTFIPELWAGRLIEKFYNTCVLAAISNTFYEGEIKQKGDKVHIRQIPTLTIFDYTAEGPALPVQRPAAGIVDLLIDKGKGFNTILDDVLRVQADMDLMDMWSNDASQQLKIEIDKQVLASMPAAVHASNKGLTAGKISANINLGVAGTPLVVGPANAAGVVGILDLIIDLGVCLDEQNIPETGRWIILPAWMVGMLLKSELRSAQIMGDATSAFRNGRVGECARFTVYQSNLLPTATETAKTATFILAGHSNGLTFASQLTQMETLRAESTFGTLLRGLQVYGFKMIDPTCVATAYAVR